MQLELVPRNSIKTRQLDRFWRLNVSFTVISLHYLITNEENVQTISSNPIGPPGLIIKGPGAWAQLTRLLDSLVKR